MNSNFLILFIGLANIIAAVLVYYSFGKAMDKQKKIFNTMIVVGVMYIAALIVYLLSSICIEKVSASNTAKTMLLTAFVPVNTIIMAPFLIFSYMRVQQKKLDMSKLNIRAIIVAVLAVIVLVGEFVYFRNFQKNLVTAQHQLDDAIAQNELQNQEAENNLTNSNAENMNDTNSIVANNSVENTNITMNSTSTNNVTINSTNSTANTATNSVANSTSNTTINTTK